MPRPTFNQLIQRSGTLETQLPIAEETLKDRSQQLNDAYTTYAQRENELKWIKEEIFYRESIGDFE